MMKSFIGNLLLTIVVYVTVESKTIGPIYDLDKAEEIFKKYTEVFNRHYDTADERHKRFEIFYTRLKDINTHNSNPKSTWMADINDLADWTEEEIQRTFDPKPEKKLSYRTKHPFATSKIEKLDNKVASETAVQPKPGIIYDLDKVEELFETYLKKYDKQYHSNKERQHRLETFYVTLRKINLINSTPGLWVKVDLSSYADKADEESLSLYPNGFNVTNEKNRNVQAKTEDKPFYELAKRENVLKQLMRKDNTFVNSRSYRSKKYYDAQQNRQPENKVSGYKMVRRNRFPLVRTRIKPNYDISKAPQYFQSYIDKFNKQYASTAERDMRFGIFRHTLEEINAINSDPITTWTAGLNKFSDWTEEELDELGYETSENDQNGPIYDLNKAEEYFENFIKEHDRHYDSLAEKNMRFDIFYTTLKTINSVNSDPAATWTADTNDFSDWTDEELKEVLSFITPLGSEKETKLGVIGASEYFKLYIEKFNKHYTSPAERDMRFGIFCNTLAKVNEINSDSINTWSAVLNEYSDRTEEELDALFGSETMDKKPTNGPTYLLNNAKELFEIFIRMFGRHYDSLAEKLMRFAIFYDTLKTINLINSDPTEKLFADINDYSDWTDDELMNRALIKK